MLLIWKGWGILVPIIFMIGGVAGVGIGDMLADADGNPATWPVGLMLVLTSVITWYAGKYFNDKPGKVLVDPNSGEHFELKNTHTLFFIKFEYWAFVQAALGIFFFISEFV